MDQDLMDAWLNCAYGVDCDTHRRALSEIQRLRNAPSEDLDDLWAEVTVLTTDRDTLRAQLDAERKRSADLLRRLEAIVDFAREKAV